jgi:predicted GNAT family N-acyltransferase
MTWIRITEITRRTDRDAAYSIRRAVFCDEQEVDPALEFDGLDDDCRQYLATLGDRPVGTARLRDAGGGVMKIERVAVLASDRKKGIGKALMLRAMDDARAAGAATVAIHAQCHAEKFYGALGFHRIGEIFEEASIPHIRMELK